MLCLVIWTLVERDLIYYIFRYMKTVLSVSHK